MNEWELTDEDVAGWDLTRREIALLNAPNLHTCDWDTLVAWETKLAKAAQRNLGELAKALAQAQVEVLEAPALTRPEW